MSVSGTISTELATLRRKNIELQLDTIPVKRLRTVASPGFLTQDSERERERKQYTPSISQTQSQTQTPSQVLSQGSQGRRDNYNYGNNNTGINDNIGNNNVL